MWRLTTCYDSDGHPFLRSTNGHQGRQVWVYDADAGTDAEKQEVERLREAFTDDRLKQKHSSDELLRLQKVNKSQTVKPPPLPQSGQDPSAEGVKEHLEAGMGFHSMLQMDDGHFPGDYGGPMFLLPGLLIACYVTGSMDTVFTAEHKREMLRYFRNHQNEDGGFGLHIEGTSTMFGTGLCYVSMRLLGVGPDDPSTARARSWILARGDVTYITSWGKFWLAVLGCFSWDGMNPITPEVWLLPYSAWTGIGWAHPGRYWCHCRMVYLPMSYLYGIRATGSITPLVASLREELFDRDYATVDWNAARNRCAREDLYYPHPWLQNALWWVLYKAENVLLGSALRRAALREVMKLVHYEDENTRYIDIGPVNKALNLVCCWFEDPEGEPFKRHLARVADYLWVAEDGLKMQGYNGSQLWDTAFTVQAYAASGLLSGTVTAALTRAHTYVKNTQVVQEAEQPLTRYYRHISEGAWPFSTRDHGWPISDCTSEGLKAALALAALPPAAVGDPLPDSALCAATNVILSYQNANGGWPTYELQRSFAAIEILNPAETFGDIMVDYSYVECSSACITALCAFRKRVPGHRDAEIEAALRRGRAWVEGAQREDGSWYGSWAVCFTYGCWFGAKALRALGETVDTCDAQRRVAAFLVQRQRADGGWGESYLSCQDKVYSQLSGDSHVVNTGWAMLALMAAGAHASDPAPLHRGAAFLMRAQLGNGDWPQQHISGVFNRNCMITYANYRNIFPVWALGVYRRLVLLGEPYVTGM